MKRSKSVELHQDTSAYPVSQTHNQDFYSSYRIPKSTRREYQDAVDHFSSSSSSSSSSTADLERVNRAALLRYKSLDSIAFNNRKSNINGKSNNNNHRRIQSKTVEYDFDSDDSVCGIPKPRR